MIEINKEYLVKIIDEDASGNGITRINDFVVIVPYSFKEEEILIKIIKINKRYANSKIIKIINASPKRQKVLCDSYDNCGSCSFLHSSIKFENNKKIEYLEKLFNIAIEYTNSKCEYNYRNKAIFHIKNNKIGYYSEKTHNIIEFKNCLLLDKRINKIYNLLKDIDLRNISEILIRTTKNEILIKSDNEFDYEKLLKNINIDSIYIKDKLVYGKNYIIEEINNIKFTIYPDSFFQVNPTNIKLLFDKVKEYSGKGNNLLDLYCGTGSISLYLKDNFNKITGIEINPSSIKNANINKILNNTNNINFILGDSKIAKNNNYDVIVVDPPRSGLSKEVINFLNNSNSKIVYVSCNPITLKRDLELLNNFKMSKLCYVNMFIKTKHMECVCLLEKN